MFGSVNPYIAVLDACVLVPMPVCDTLLRLLDTMHRAFEDAIVTGHSSLESGLEVEQKDRHVLAAAIICGASAIVTDNLRDFPESALKPFSMVAQSADDFLVHQYHLDSDTFIDILEQQAADVGKSFADLLALLARAVPDLAQLIKA